MLKESLQRWLGPSDAEMQLKSELKVARSNAQLSNHNMVMLQERLTELESVLLTPEWARISAEGEREFSEEGLRAAMKLSRMMFLSNPLINRGVTLKSQYVWGQGYSITCKSDAAQAAVQKAFNSNRNKKAFTSHQLLTLREQELQVTGNLYIALFRSINGAVTIRCIPADEISDIISNPEDSTDVWYYKRQWKRTVYQGSGKRDEVLTALYADLDNDSPAETFAGLQVQANVRVYHVRIGALADMRKGLPETYQSIPWARSYKDFLTDFIAIVKSFRKFAFSVEVEGGPQQVSEIHSALNTRYADGTNGASYDQNPAPVAGSTMVSSGVSLNPVKTAGATVPLEEGRRLLLMHCAGSGFPETFYGDASVGSLATAKSLDRPTELMISDRQKLWKEILETIANYIIAAGSNNREIEEMEAQMATVTFPPVVEHDLASYVEAVTMAATLDGKELSPLADFETFARLLLEALGVSNVDEVLKRIMEEQEKREEEKAAAPPPPPPAGAPPPPESTEEAAARRLGNAIGQRIAESLRYLEKGDSEQ